MAPRKPITRSDTKHHGTQLSGPLTVRRKRYTCIICSKIFGGSKNWVLRHWKTHETIPYRMDDENGPELLPAFTHPSCWPAEETMNWDRINALSRFKEDRDSIDSVNVTPSELNAWIKKDHMEEVGALTPEEYETKKELQDLRRWWWWWEVQNGAIVDRIENGVAGNFEINGDAGYEDQRTRWEIKAQAFHSFAIVPHMPWESRGRKFKSKASNRQRRDGMTFFPRDGEGRLFIPIDINENKLLRAETILQCLSQAITYQVSQHGETDEVGGTLGHATITFLRTLSSHDHDQTIQDGFIEAIRQVEETMNKRRWVFYQADNEDETARQVRDERTDKVVRDDFRSDRAERWSHLGFATRVYFDYHGVGDRELRRWSKEEMFLVEAAVDFAVALKDAKTQEKLEAFAAGGGELDNILDSQFGENRR